MIYLKTNDGKHLVILEPANLEDMKRGAVQGTTNHEVLIAYTPDASWLGEQIFANIKTLTSAKLHELVKESLNRPEVKERPYHPDLKVSSGKKVKGDA